MDINPPKGLLAQDECLDKQIKPLESLGEKSLEKQLEKNVLEIELFWEECLVKQKNPQVSLNKTPSSTLDTLDVSSVKDKEKIQLKILHGLGRMNANIQFSKTRTKNNSNLADNGLLIDGYIHKIKS